MIVFSSVFVYDGCEVTDQCPQNSRCESLNGVKRCQCFHEYKSYPGLQKCVKQTPNQSSDGEFDTLIHCLVVKASNLVNFQLLTN